MGQLGLLSRQNLLSVLESSQTDKDKFGEGLRLEIFLGDGSEKARGRQWVGARALKQSQQMWAGALEWERESSQWALGS